MDRRAELGEDLSSYWHWPTEEWNPHSKGRFGALQHCFSEVSVGPIWLVGSIIAISGLTLHLSKSVQTTHVPRFYSPREMNWAIFIPSVGSDIIQLEKHFHNLLLGILGCPRGRGVFIPSIESAMEIYQM